MERITVTVTEAFSKDVLLEADVLEMDHENALCIVPDHRMLLCKRHDGIWQSVQTWNISPVLYRHRSLVEVAALFWKGELSEKTIAYLNAQS